MKKQVYIKPAVLLLSAAVVLLFLTACSGVIGGDTTVRISIPQLADGSAGRFISTASNSGYVVVMQESKVYSLNSFSDRAYQELENGNVFITNLPVGSYIFGVVLMDDTDDTNVGLAIKKRDIKKGYNDIVIDVGPGIDIFTINDISFEDFFAPDGYSTTFEEDTIILDIDRTPPDSVVLNFETGSVTTATLIPSGDPFAGTVPIDQDGVEYTITDGLFTHPYTLRIILK